MGIIGTYIDYDTRYIIIFIAAAKQVIHKRSPHGSKQGMAVF